MMLGERNRGGTTFQFPPWSFTADNRNSVDDHSVFSQTNSLTAPLHLHLPSNYHNDAVEEFQYVDPNTNGNGGILPVDSHSCDQFRMFEFKVKMCSRARSHDWTDCPFAHPAEKARRRDPRKFHYSGTACPDFRTGSCPRGDACEFAHGVFEHWLHPARYRTQPCKDGMSCTRRVCFFAHSPDQLRVLSPRAESPHRVAAVSSPETVSPPISPMSANYSIDDMVANYSIDDMVASLRQLQLNKVMPITRPTTPTRTVTRTRFGCFERSGEAECEECCVMERVESGRDLRFRMFEKLSKENRLDRVNFGPDPNTDVGWVLELVK